MDVDGMTLLGGELAERVSGVDEGDRDHKYQSQIQKAELLCEETCQHNKNANANVPSTYKLPLEGEWTGYVSGKSNELKGCSGGMGKCASVDEADGNPGHGIEPTNAPNELTEFIGLSVELYVENSSDTLCVCLGGTPSGKTNNAIDHYLSLYIAIGHYLCNNHIMASIPYPPYL